MTREVRSAMTMCNCGLTAGCEECNPATFQRVSGNCGTVEYVRIYDKPTGGYRIAEYDLRKDKMFKARNKAKMRVCPGLEGHPKFEYDPDIHIIESIRIEMDRDDGFAPVSMVLEVGAKYPWNIEWVDGFVRINPGDTMKYKWVS